MADGKITGGIGALGGAALTAVIMLATGEMGEVEKSVDYDKHVMAVECEKVTAKKTSVPPCTTWKDEEKKEVEKIVPGYEVNEPDKIITKKTGGETQYFSFDTGDSVEIVVFVNGVKTRSVGIKMKEPLPSADYKWGGWITPGITWLLKTNTSW